MDEKKVISVPSGIDFQELQAACVSYTKISHFLQLRAEALMEVGFTRTEAIELIKERLI